MIIQRDFESQKAAAVNLFREILNTPYVMEVDFHFSGSTHEPMVIEYEIKRAVVAENED